MLLPTSATQRSVHPTASLSRPAGLAPKPMDRLVHQAAGRPVAQSIDRMQKRPAAHITMAMAPGAPTVLGAVQVPQRVVIAAAAAGCLPFLAAKAAVACTLGLAIRNALERVNADFEFPVEAMAALTMRQRHNAVNTLSAAACLICFLLLV